mmetsp:Transcript_62626/g.149379  ORF Transcript_62626/g.149379 Transcript_62626/m.149379 type:complete len:228 (+) Transcript_62626:1043-1726(+)
MCGTDGRNYSQHQNLDMGSLRPKGRSNGKASVSGYHHEAPIVRFGLKLVEQEAVTCHGSLPIHCRAPCHVPNCVHARCHKDHAVDQNICDADRYKSHMLSTPFKHRWTCKHSLVAVRVHNVPKRLQGLKDHNQEGCVDQSEEGVHKLSPLGNTHCTKYCCDHHVDHREQRHDSEVKERGGPQGARKVHGGVDSQGLCQEQHRFERFLPFHIQRGSGGQVEENCHVQT